MKPLARDTIVKICGITHASALGAAIESGADFVGFIFYPPSPRYVSPGRAAALGAATPSKIKRVGVFVDPADAVLAQTLVPKIGGGRCAAYELLVVTPGIANLIRENKTYRITSAIQTGAKYGMTLMDDSLFRLWRDEKITIEDAMAKAQTPDDLGKRIANAQRGLFDDDNDVDESAKGN